VGRPISVSIGELAQRPLILTAHPNVSRIVVDRAFAAARVVPNIVAEADLLSSVLSAVQSGIGETILPKGDFSDVSGHADIVATPIEPATHLVASAITASDAPLTRAGNAVRDLFISVVRNWLVENHPPGAEWIGAEWIGDKAPHIEQR
jgi:LysR family nitrogen assimilation transcriptional regulator